MKIKYEFANETIEIEVDETWGAVLIDPDRQEYNNEQKETRRHCSLDALDVDGNNIPCDCDVLRDILNCEDRAALHKAITALEPTQQEVIYALYFEGISVSEFAKMRGVSQPAITKRKLKALKNLKNILSRGL